MINIGQNFMNLVVDNAGPIAMTLLIIGGLYCLAKRKLAEAFGLLAMAIIAFVLIYNPVGVKDVLVNIGNQIMGSGTAGLTLLQVRLVDCGMMFCF